MQRLAVQFLLWASRFVLATATDTTRTSTPDAAATIAARRRPASSNSEGAPDACEPCTGDLSWLSLARWFSAVLS